MADPVGYTMVVYSLAQKKSWQISNPTFKSDPNFKKFTVAGESFEFEDGVLGMTVEKRSPFNFPDNQKDRKLFYHAFSSNHENAVSLSVLNDGNAFLANPNAQANHFQSLGER